MEIPRIVGQESLIDRSSLVKPAFRKEAVRDSQQPFPGGLLSSSRLSCHPDREDDDGEMSPDAHRVLVPTC
jgi:hypothetical protein